MTEEMINYVNWKNQLQNFGAFWDQIVLQCSPTKFQISKRNKLSQKWFNLVFWKKSMTTWIVWQRKRSNLRFSWLCDKFRAGRVLRRRTRPTRPRWGSTGSTSHPSASGDRPNHPDKRPCLHPRAQHKACRQIFWSEKQKKIFVEFISHQK